MPKLNLYQLAGWYGLSALLLAYALTSLTPLSSNSPFFQILNLTGALGIIIISHHKKVKQLVILNTIWAAVAGYMLFKIVFLG